MLVQPSSQTMGAEYERYQGVEKHSSGFKLLAAMGWKEGQGLGAKGQGRKEHIKVRRRQDSSGIGLAEATKKSRDWTIGMVAYDQVLAKLSSVSGEPHGKRKRRDADTAMVNEEGSLPAEQDDAAVGTEKARKRKKKGPESNALDTVAVSASGAPATLETDELQASVKSSHTARFARRRAGKNVRSYSGSDLAAILGGGGAHSVAAPGSAEAGEGPTISRTPLPDKTSSAEDEQPSAGLAEAGSNQRMDQPDDGFQDKKWWHGYFTPAGRLGSAAPAKMPSSALAPQVKVNGFSEADQENLYHLAHDKKGQGRQGLGIASRPKKVAGARWQGKKTTIGDSDEEEDAEREATGPAESEDCSDDTQIFSEEPASASAAAGTEQPSVDKKVLKRQAVLVLKAATGGLALKKLEKRVLDGLGILRRSPERTAARKLLRQVVDASSKMSVKDGLVVFRKR